MPIITLTTDLGCRDNYVALLKAYILKKVENVQVIDISHELEKFNLQQAAYIFGNSFYEFPKNSIHVLGIRSANFKHNKNLIIYYKNQYILCPDNGLFSLFYDGSDVVYYELNANQYPQGIFISREPFAKAAVDLANGKFITDMAIEISDIVQSLNFQPVSHPGGITGRCIYIDSFGNVITNVKKSFFENIQQGRNFTIFLPNTRISKIYNSYDEAEHNEPLALFNSSGHLEIALNNGSAKQLLFPRNFISHIEFQIPIEFYS
jgi:S-adenosylmethionine hydrolase